MPAYQTRCLRGNRSFNIHIKRHFIIFKTGKIVPKKYSESLTDRIVFISILNHVL
jgi:hypothetical protein